MKHLLCFLAISLVSFSEQDTFKKRSALDTVVDHNKRQGVRDPEERVNVAEAAMI